MMQIAPSKTLEFHAKISEFVRSGRKIISLGLGEAECGTPRHIVDAGIKALNEGRTKYSSSAGLLELREKIAEKLFNDNNIDAKSNEIVVTPGAKNALYLSCLSLLNDGDEVVLIRPCYVSNYPIVKLANSNTVIKEVDLIKPEFELDLDAIEKSINSRTKLLFLNTPHNPTGKMIRQYEFDFLVDLLQKYPKLHILSDEVYERIITGSCKHLSLASNQNISERVITVNGFSKAYFMTGWRVGYLHSKSKYIISKAVKIQQHINTNTAVFVQMAALAALNGDQNVYLNYIEQLKERKMIYEDFLNTNNYLTGSSYEGGYFTFIDISKTRLDGDEFATRLLEEKGVAVVPGVVFGEKYTDFFRLSFVNTTELFEEGLYRISNFVKEL